jgi:hypothetical protein
MRRDGLGVRQLAASLAWRSLLRLCATADGPSKSLRPGGFAALLEFAHFGWRGSNRPNTRRKQACALETRALAPSTDGQDARCLDWPSSPPYNPTVEPREFTSNHKDRKTP